MLAMHVLSSILISIIVEIKKCSFKVVQGKWNDKNNKRDKKRKMLHKNKTYRNKKWDGIHSLYLPTYL